MKNKIIFLFLLIAGITSAQSDPFDNTNFFYHTGDTVKLKPFYVSGIGSPLPTTAEFDTLTSNVIHIRNTDMSIYTSETGNRSIRFLFASSQDSANMRIGMAANGGIFFNKYGGVHLGNGGNPYANDSIAVKIRQNNTFWRYAMAWTSNSTMFPTTGIKVNLPENTDSIVFTGIVSTGKYNFVGDMYAENITTPIIKSSTGLTASITGSFELNSADMSLTAEQISFTTTDGSLSFVSAGSLNFQDQDGPLLIMKPFGTPTSSAVTPANMSTAVLTLSDGSTLTVYVPATP